MKCTKIFLFSVLLINLYIHSMERDDKKAQQKIIPVTDVEPKTDISSVKKELKKLELDPQPNVFTKVRQYFKDTTDLGLETLDDLKKGKKVLARRTERIDEGIENSIRKAINLEEKHIEIPFQVHDEKNISELERKRKITENRWLQIERLISILKENKRHIEHINLFLKGAQTQELDLQLNEATINTAFDYVDLNYLKLIQEFLILIGQETNEYINLAEEIQKGAVSRKQAIAKQDKKTLTIPDKIYAHFRSIFTSIKTLPDSRKDTK